MKDVPGLADEVMRSINEPGEFSLKRRELAAKLSYNPGRAGDAAADTIMKILNI